MFSGGLDWGRGKDNYGIKKFAHGEPSGESGTTPVGNLSSSADAESDVKDVGGGGEYVTTRVRRRMELIEAGVSNVETVDGQTASETKAERLVTDYACSERTMERRKQQWNK